MPNHRPYHHIQPSSSTTLLFLGTQNWGTGDLGLESVPLEARGVPGHGWWPGVEPAAVLASHSCFREDLRSRALSRSQAGPLGLLPSTRLTIAQSTAACPALCQDTRPVLKGSHLVGHLYPSNFFKLFLKTQSHMGSNKSRTEHSRPRTSSV